MPGAYQIAQLNIQKLRIRMKNKKLLKKTWKKPELKSLKFNQTLGGINVGEPEGATYTGSRW